MFPFDRLDVKMVSPRSQTLQVRLDADLIVVMIKKKVPDKPLTLAVLFSGVGSLLPLLPLLKGQVVELSPSTRVQLEELQLEGDLLEVSLDQTNTIHRVLQAASDPPTDTLRTLIQVRQHSFYISS